MSDHTSNTQLEMAELYALDLDADTGEQIRMLQELRQDLALSLEVGKGAVSAARERFEAATRATEVLLDHMRVHRKLLNDLRTSLRQLRSSLRVTGMLSDERYTAPKPDEPGD
jgi:hypothetical protein